MTFGQMIKMLRLDAEMTQAQLAELLSISPQAVSRWESDTAMPDISLLPPLANIFGVTTDYLLGMDTYQKDLRKSEFDEAFFEYWKKDDKEKNYQIAVRAAAEYPGNMQYIEWLASAEYYIAIPTLDNVEYRRLLESSINHYKLVIQNTKDRELLNRALSGIVFALSMIGRKNEAKEYAMRIENENSRNEILIWCLEGQERTKHGQQVAENQLCSFLTNIRFAGSPLEYCRAVEEILKILFPDGNYQYYHNFLQYNSISKAQSLCNEKRYGEMLNELKKARFHAEEMTKYAKQTQYSFTAPLFNLLSGKKAPTDSDTTDIDDFIRCLNNNRCFDPIREKVEFQELLKK